MAAPREPRCRPASATLVFRGTMFASFGGIVGPVGRIFSPVDGIIGPVARLSAAAGQLGGTPRSLHHATREAHHPDLLDGPHRLSSSSRSPRASALPSGRSMRQLDGAPHHPGGWPSPLGRRAARRGQCIAPLGQRFALVERCIAPLEQCNAPLERCNGTIGRDVAPFGCCTAPRGW